MGGQVGGDVLRQRIGVKIPAYPDGVLAGGAFVGLQPLAFMATKHFLDVAHLEAPDHLDGVSEVGAVGQGVNEQGQQAAEDQRDGIIAGFVERRAKP